jgi:hypothetical protein
MRKVLFALLSMTCTSLAYGQQGELRSTWMMTPSPDSSAEAITSGKVLSAVAIPAYRDVATEEGMATRGEGQIPHLHIYMHGTNPEVNNLDIDIAISINAIK